jgi:hypothetical protein
MLARIQRSALSHMARLSRETTKKETNKQTKTGVLTLYRFRPIYKLKKII